MATSTFGVVVSLQHWSISIGRRPRAHAPTAGQRRAVLARCLLQNRPDRFSRTVGFLFFPALGPDGGMLWTAAYLN